MEILTGNERQEFLAIARIVKTQGRRGEVLAETLTDFPERFRELRRVFVETPGSPPEQVTVEKTWPHKGRIVFKLAAADSITRAERLIGRHLFIPVEERMPLGPGRYYIWELTGCQVVREQGKMRSVVGTVTDVAVTAGAPLLRVTRAGRHESEVLIPLAQAICTLIDPKTKTIIIDPPEDLLELNQPEDEGKNGL